MDMLDSALKSIQSLAGRAAQPEQREAGPGDVGPTVGKSKAGDPNLITLQMSEDELGEWWKRIERAEARVAAREKQWDLLLKEYLPNVSATGVAETVKYNGHFMNVHTKIGQLFYRQPDLILTPKDPSPAQNQQPAPMPPMMPGMPPPPPQPPITLEDIISVKQEVLNCKMGRDGIKVGRLMDELLFDVLAWSGIGAAKIGYQCYFKDIQQPKMQPQPIPTPPPGSILGLSVPSTMQSQPPVMVPATDPNTGQPVMETVSVPVYEDYYWRRFSPKKALWNDDLRSTRFDEDATWTGMIFYLSPKRAMKLLGLTEDEVSKASEDDRVAVYEQDKQARSPGLLKCYELWPKASYFRDDEPHPLALDQLVLVKGLEHPAVYRPSPDQEFDEKGQLTQDSLIGFPIRVLTIRDLADSSFPLSDSAFTNTNIKEIGTYRRQSVQLRDAAIGKYLYDLGAFDKDTDLPLLKSGAVGEYVGVEAGKLAQGADKIFTTTAKVQATNDDYRGADILKRDMQECIGIGANQAGVETDTVRTATEATTVQSGFMARNEKELSRVVDYYLDGARMLDQLLMRYATQEDYVHIAGTEGAQRMMVWNNQIISGRFLYDIAPDSQLRMDTARDYQQLSTFYNLAAKDPLFNRAYVLRRMARMRGLDPSKIVLPPPAQVVQPPHGGTGEVVNQHQASNSGGKPNAPGADNHREQQLH